MWESVKTYNGVQLKWNWSLNQELTIVRQKNENLPFVIATEYLPASNRTTRNIIYVIVIATRKTEFEVSIATWKTVLKLI